MTGRSDLLGERDAGRTGTSANDGEVSPASSSERETPSKARRAGSASRSDWKVEKPACLKAGARSARPLRCSATARGSGAKTAAAARRPPPCAATASGRARPCDRPDRPEALPGAAKGSRTCTPQAHRPRCPAPHAQALRHGGNARPGKSHTPGHVPPGSMAENTTQNHSRLRASSTSGCRPRSNMATAPVVLHVFTTLNTLSSPIIHHLSKAKGTQRGRFSKLRSGNNVARPWSFELSVGHSEVEASLDSARR